MTRLLFPSFLLSLLMLAARSTLAFSINISLRNGYMSRAGSQQPTRSYKHFVRRQPTPSSTTSLLAASASASSSMFAPFRSFWSKTIFATTLSLPQWSILAIYWPSALSKVLLRDNVMAKLWPRLPRWLWPAVALWEMVGSALAVLAPSCLGAVGFCMLYAFMGGVLSSLVYVGDDDGNTFVSGKGPLGHAGWLPLVPALGSTLVLFRQDAYLARRGLQGPCGLLALGFGVGVWIYQSSLSLRKVG